MDYRLPLFKILKNTFKNDIVFWFYRDVDKAFQGRYFSHFDIKISLFSRKLHRQFSLSSIWALIRENESKIVVLNGANANYELPFFSLILKLRRKKIIFWTETWDWGEMGCELNLFFKLNNFIAKRSDIVLYPGKKVNELYNSLKILDSKQIFMPNASENYDRVDQEYIDEIVKPTQGKIHIVYLARIIPRKGLNYLIEAIKLLPSYTYELIIGGGTESFRYEKECREIAENCSNIRFVGDVKKQHVNTVLSIADVYVYPSVNMDGMAEPWGLSLNEAIALGKPCVATDMVASAYDLIEEGMNGFIVKEKDSHALAKAIEKAVSLSKESVLETCKKKNEIYSYENMAKGFITAINRLII